MNQYHPPLYPNSMHTTPSTYPNPGINPYASPNYNRSTYGHIPIDTNSPQNSSNPRAILVSGIEEARAARIDFDGSLLICVNINNGEVYSKQMAPNGSVVFSRGTLIPEIQVSPTTNSSYIETYDRIAERLSAIEAQLAKFEGVKTNDRSKSDAADSNVSGKSESTSNSKTNGR